VLQALLTQLYNIGPFTDGIFRKSASLRKTREVKERMETGAEVDFQDVSVFVCCAILKVSLSRVYSCLMPWLHASIFPFEVSSVFPWTRKSDTSDDTWNDAFDFLVRGSDGRLLAGRQKTSSEEIGQNEHSHAVQFCSDDVFKPRKARRRRTTPWTCSHSITQLHPLFQRCLLLGSVLRQCHFFSFIYIALLTLEMFYRTLKIITTLFYYTFVNAVAGNIMFPECSCVHADCVHESRINEISKIS